jgi:hypothetical protein
LANLLDKFKKNVIGSNNTINDYTSVITPSGDFKRITNFEAILKRSNFIIELEN